LVIFRPSIIACAYRQPFRGWTDSLSAAGGLSLLTGMGLMKYVNGDGKGPFDIVPVDFVVNGMLISTCKGASEKDYFEVYNSGTSYSNQITVKDYRNIGLKAYKNKRL
jgi:hypothetical protein